MKICRFDDNRLGLVRGDTVLDVSAALAVLPAVSWPLPMGDLMIAHLRAVKAEIARLAPTARAHALAGLRLGSPVANPSRILAAPLNYRAHVDEAANPALNYGVHMPDHDGFDTPVAKMGLFLKASAALVGPAAGVTIAFPQRRNDHEVELVCIIGRGGRGIPAERAMAHVAGYAIGLDMTVRGTEDRSFRKSADSYAVLGPWLVTADEINDPGNLDLSLRVDGVIKQTSNTSMLLVGIPALIALASSIAELHPGDLIYTGTPEGVSEVRAGQTMTAEIQGIGRMTVAVH